MRIARREPTRLGELRRGADDVVGRLCWSATRWYGRQVRSEIRDGVVRWSAVAGGVAVLAALANAARRRVRQPSAQA